MKFSIFFALIIFFNVHLFVKCILKVRLTHGSLEYYEKHAKWNRPINELMDVLIKKTSCEAQYITLPWKRALIELKKGNIVL